MDKRKLSIIKTIVAAIVLAVVAVGCTCGGDDPDNGSGYNGCTPGWDCPGDQPNCTPGFDCPGDQPNCTPGVNCPGDQPECTPGVTCPGNPVIDPALVLSSGQAWVDTYPIGERDGFIFASNGTFRAVNDAQGGVWAVSATGSAFTSVNGDKLTVAVGWLYPDFEAGIVASYSVSSKGDTLTLVDNEKGWDYIFVKTSGVNPSSMLAKSRRHDASYKSKRLDHQDN